MSSPYDTIAELYDPWSASVVEDVAFYLEEARRSGGPVVELGVGTGRIAVPIAADGIEVIFASATFETRRSRNTCRSSSARSARSCTCTRTTIAGGS